MCDSYNTAVPEVGVESPEERQQRIELEAYAFRELVQHLQQTSGSVQNIDLMNLAGFCRNCLAKW